MNWTQVKSWYLSWNPSWRIMRILWVRNEANTISCRVNFWTCKISSTHRSRSISGQPCCWRTSWRDWFSTSQICSSRRRGLRNNCKLTLTQLRTNQLRSGQWMRNLLWFSFCWNRYSLSCRRRTYQCSHCKRCKVPWRKARGEFRSCCHQPLQKH